MKRQVRLSTKRYSRAKFAVYHAMRTLKFALRDAYFLQLSKIAFRSTVSDRNVSAPGGARNRFGAETAKKPKQNKKPGDERRANPSISLGRMCSKLDFFLPGVRNQPHLWMSRQARSVSRLPRESGLHQHQESISKSKVQSSCIQDFFMCLSQSPCEFHRCCGNPH